MEINEFKKALGAAELNTLKRFNNFMKTLKSFDLQNEKVSLQHSDNIQIETINQLSHRQDSSPKRRHTKSPKERLSAEGSNEYEVRISKYLF